MDYSNITVIVPTLNEEENIKRLLEQIHGLYPSINTIVVDDGSTDQTVKKVMELMEQNENIRLIDRRDEKVKGLTISIRDGILATKTKWFMVMDGDFQHPPEYLADAFKCIEKDADLIVGKRIKIEEWPFTRKMISYGAQVLGKIALFVRRRQRPSDIMSGFFGGKTAILKEFAKNDKILEFTGYKFLFDVLKVFPRDKTICEFGYIFRNREFGTSKIGRKQIIAFAKSLF